MQFLNVMLEEKILFRKVIVRTIKVKLNCFVTNNKKSSIFFVKNVLILKNFVHDDEEKKYHIAFFSGSVGNFFRDNMKIRAIRLCGCKKRTSISNNGNDYCSISRTESNLARHFLIIKLFFKKSLKKQARKSGAFPWKEENFFELCMKVVYLTKLLLRNLPLIKKQ